MIDQLTFSSFSQQQITLTKSNKKGDVIDMNHTQEVVF